MRSAAHLRHLRASAEKRLSLRAVLEQPGDGRRYPQIRARSLAWMQLIVSRSRNADARGLVSHARHQARPVQRRSTASFPCRQSFSACLTALGNRRKISVTQRRTTESRIEREEAAGQTRGQRRRTTNQPHEPDGRDRAWTLCRALNRHKERQSYVPV